MKKQIMFSAMPFNIDCFDKPRNDDRKAYKPFGGLWTCDIEKMDGKYTSCWQRFVWNDLPANYRYRLDHCYEFTPKEDVRVLYVERIRDIDDFFFERKYIPTINWEKVIDAGYDGVYFNKENSSYAVDDLFSSWDFTSTCWFNLDWFSDFRKIPKDEIYDCRM